MLSPGQAIETYQRFLATQPFEREGLHVSDVASDQGWKCDRFLLLVLEGATRNPIPGRIFHIGRLELGTSFHEVVYRSVQEALTRQALLLGCEIMQIHIEAKLEDPVSGLQGSPDILVQVRRGDEVFWQVHDVKSTTTHALMGMYGKAGKLNVPKTYLRQLLLYAQMAHARHAGFIFAIIEPPFQLRDHFVAPNPKTLEEVRVRVMMAQTNLVEGRLPGKIPQKSYCAQCPVALACEAKGVR